MSHRTLLPAVILFVAGIPCVGAVAVAHFRSQITTAQTLCMAQVPGTRIADATRHLAALDAVVRRRTGLEVIVGTAHGRWTWECEIWVDATMTTVTRRSFGWWIDDIDGTRDDAIRFWIQRNLAI